ncbi:MAG: DUF1565 domain-containing protein [Acidobacteriota bacterium]
MRWHRPDLRWSTAWAVVALFACPLHATQPPEFTGVWSDAHSAQLAGPADRAEARGQPDLAARATSNFMWDRVYIVTSESTLALPVLGAVSDVAAADFDADGALDLAVADFLRSKVDVYVAMADGSYRHRTVIRIGDGPVELSVRDFDGDGRPDVSTANLFDRSISRARGLGDGRFLPATTKAGGSSLRGPLFDTTGPPLVDYSELKDALRGASMDAGAKTELRRYVRASEKAYDAHNVRRAIFKMKQFINTLVDLPDSDIGSAVRTNLKQLATDVIRQLLGNAALSVIISATPATIAEGGTATLEWTSQRAVSASIDNGIGSVPVNGSLMVQPTSTTTYKIVVKDRRGHSESDSVTVTVGGAANTIYVDQDRGSDTTGDGSFENPYETITKGLSVATSGWTVSVAPGFYEADSGETFPLFVPDGVALRGAGMKKTYIAGAGSYVPPTASIPIPTAYGVCVVPGDNTSLSSLALVGGGGVGVYVTFASVSLTDCRISNFGGGGPAATTDLRGVPIGGGAVTVGDAGSASLQDCTLSFNWLGTLLGSLMTQNGAEAVPIAAGVLSLNRCTVKGYMYGCTCDVAGATLTMRDTTVSEHTYAGVMVWFQGTYDLGTTTSPGGNVFHNLWSPTTAVPYGTNNGILYGNNVRNMAVGAVIYAVGNTWDNSPPTVDSSGFYAPGYDISRRPDNNVVY